MKKISILFLILVLVIPVFTVSADSFTITAETKSAKPGEHVDIDVILENNPGIISALLKIEYDRERLTLLSANDGKLLEGGFFSQTADTFPFVLLWNSAVSENSTENGTLATLTFEVKNNADAGDAHINISYRPDDIYDVNLITVPVTLKNGKISVSQRKSSGGGRDGIKIEPKPDESNIVYDAEKKQVILTIDKKEANVFGELKTNDVAPIIRNSRTMLPARFIAESLGAMVAWQEETKTVTVTRDSTELKLLINSDIAYINGEPKKLDSPAFIENDRTYTPLRFIAEALSAKIDWIEDTKEVVITVP